MPTKIEVKILEDGKLQVTTGDIEDAKHLDADQLLDELEEVLGGVRVTEKRDHPFWKNKNVLRGGRVVTAGSK